MLPFYKTRKIEPELKKAQEQIQRQQWENERKKISNNLSTKCIGCVWDEKKPGFNQLVQYKVNGFKKVKLTSSNKNISIYLDDSSKQPLFSHKYYKNSC